MPVAYRLYLPQSRIEDRKRGKKTGCRIRFSFRPSPKLPSTRSSVRVCGVVLADAGYGTDTGFRAVLTKLKMAYVVGIQSTTTVWKLSLGLWVLPI